MGHFCMSVEKYVDNFKPCDWSTRIMKLTLLTNAIILLDSITSQFYHFSFCMEGSPNRMSGKKEKDMRHEESVAAVGHVCTKFIMFFSLA